MIMHKTRLVGSLVDMLGLRNTKKGIGDRIRHRVNVSPSVGLVAQ